VNGPDGRSRKVIFWGAISATVVGLFLCGPPLRVEHYYFCAWCGTQVTETWLEMCFLPWGRRWTEPIATRRIAIYDELIGVPHDHDWVSDDTVCRPVWASAQYPPMRRPTLDVNRTHLRDIVFVLLIDQMKLWPEEERIEAFKALIGLPDVAAFEEVFSGSGSEREKVRRWLDHRRQAGTSTSPATGADTEE